MYIILIWTLDSWVAYVTYCYLSRTVNTEYSKTFYLLITLIVYHDVTE